MSFEDDKRAILERKRNLLYLISKYLSDLGLKESNDKLLAESHIPQSFQICDNIDLDQIYLEFQSYFFLKFGKKPKVLKKCDESGGSGGSNAIPITPVVRSKTTKGGVGTPAVAKPGSKGGRKCEEDKADSNYCNSFDGTMVVSQLLSNGEIIQPEKIVSRSNDSGDFGNFSMCSLNLEDYPPDWRDLVQLISREIIRFDLGVRWSDIYGASDAKILLQEGILLPLEYPNLFQNFITPWRSILLHGPPGTGKTLLAKALCSETFGKVTFFNISPSTLVSKWRGESEKIIRVLFDVAKNCAPSIIYLDEIECITSQRDKAHEHEASKRFKNEFLTLMDGLESNTNLGIFILANTNLPWDVDAAFLRRFEKKLLIDLPKQGERVQIIKHFLLGMNISDGIINDLGVITNNFTGDEIRLACKEIKMTQIRRTISLKQKTLISSVDLDDIFRAFKHITPASSAIIVKHREWNRNYQN